MSALTKIPPFILANTRNLEGNYIIHTKEPRFIAKIFNPESREQELNIKSILGHWIELETPKTIIGIIESWGPEASEDKLEAAIKRLKHWYCSILNEQSK